MADRVVQHLWRRSGAARLEDGVWRRLFDCVLCGTRKAELGELRPEIAAQYAEWRIAPVVYQVPRGKFQPGQRYLRSYGPERTEEPPCLDAEASTTMAGAGA